MGVSVVCVLVCIHIQQTLSAFLVLMYIATIINVCLSVQCVHVFC